MARLIIGEDAFLEVHVNTPLLVCEERDPKGMYKLARAGELPAFTGVSAPYEPPQNPLCSIDTANCSVDECVDLLMGILEPFLSVKK
jgi:adenylylsulfate kinase-like enzyme